MVYGVCVALGGSLLKGQDVAGEEERVLEPLVVTGSVWEEPLKDAPVRTEVIGRELIAKSAARDLSQIVEYSPGVRIESTCANCSQPSIQLLGLPQSYIAILSDGLPTFTGLAGVYGIEQIPAGLIGQVEVVKGGGSTLYGPGAVAGVINLIPREPFETGGVFEIRAADSAGKVVGGGLPIDLFGSYDWVVPEKDFKITVFGDRRDTKAVDLSGDGFTDVSERLLLTGGLRAIWEPRLGTEFTFDYFISDEDRRGGETGAAFEGPPNLAVIAEEIFTTRQVASLKWEQEITEAFRTQAAYAYARTRRDSYYGGTVALGSPDPGSQFFDASWTPDRGFGETQSDLHLFDGLLIHDVSDGHRLWYGVQFRTENIADDQSAIGRRLDESYSNLGFLVQHRWQMSDWATAEYGARVDFHSAVDDAVLSPRMNFLIEPNSQFRIRNSLAWGFRAPEVFDEDLHIANVGGELQATELADDLKEESSISVSIAPEWQITDRWRIELNGFHTWLRDSFVDIPNDDAVTTEVSEFLKINGGDSKVYGAELNLGYVADNWRVEFSWTEQRARYDERQLLLGDDTFGDLADNPIFSGRYPRTPQSLGLVKFFHENDWFDSFLALKLTGPMDVPEIVSDGDGELVGNRLKRSPWFFNLDVGISKEFHLPREQSLTASLGVKNLLNDFQKDLSQGAFRDADYVYGPVFPRMVHAGLKWEF